MSEKEKPQYRASFVFTDEILRDFEALYLEKKKLSPTARVVLGLLGALGAGYFGWMLWREGVQFTRIGYLLICSVLLVLAFASGKKRPDDTIRKYRASYLNKRATYSFGSDAQQVRRGLRPVRHRALLLHLRQGQGLLHPAEGRRCRGRERGAAKVPAKKVQKAFPAF